MGSGLQRHRAGPQPLRRDYSGMDSGSCRIRCPQLSQPDSARCSQVCPEVGAGGDCSGRNMDTTLEELQPPNAEGPVVQQVRPWGPGGLRGTYFAANKMKPSAPSAPEDRTEQEQGDRCLSFRASQ